MLDPSFFAEGGRAIADRDHRREFDGPTATRVAAAGAGAMGEQTPLDVGGPAAVEAVIGAAEQVDEHHPSRVRHGGGRACSDPRAATAIASRDEQRPADLQRECGPLANARRAVTERRSWLEA